MKFCPNCGAEVDEHSSFCTSCGSKLVNTESETTNSADDSVFGFDQEPITNQNTYYNNQTSNVPPQNENTYQPKKTNSMCLVGFILSFFFSFIGFVVSCIGLSQVKKNPNETGKGFAVAGIVLGLLGTIIYIVIFFTRMSFILS